ncbi:hypothetical protein AB0E69_15570 [Kribbella sp. NPDC026611]|uniref:hypothetical protein n=1 Tax=Kribbella sp. NPDC026611 TaxID=3154911 RepID=UPI0033C58645
MGVVERAEISGLHREVLDGWKLVAGQASALGLADRVVIGVALKARAEALAACERVVRDAGDLAGDARAFAAAMRSPLAGVAMGAGVAAGVLGFLGVWSAAVYGELPPTTAALVGVLLVAAAGVVIAVARAMVIARWGMAERSVSRGLLEEVRAAEEQLFGALEERVPEVVVPVSVVAAAGVCGLVIGALLASVG